jgi:5-methyltetrahydrofolate--homocysteine methyltransferase
VPGVLPPLVSHPLLDALHERVLVFDGGMGTSIQAFDPGPEDYGGASLDGCSEALVFHRPDMVADIHRSFLEVGVDIVETNTFGGAPWVLDEYDLGERCEELNTEAARIARDVADGFSTPDRPRFVAGSIGPGTKSPTLSLGNDPGQADYIDVATMEDG